MKLGDRARVVTETEQGFATRVSIPPGARGTVVGVGEVNDEVTGVTIQFDVPIPIRLSIYDVERLHGLEVLAEIEPPTDYPDGMSWRAITNRLHYFRPLPPGGNYAAQSLCQRAFLANADAGEKDPRGTVVICGPCNLRAPDDEKKLPTP